MIRTAAGVVSLAWLAVAGCSDASPVARTTAPAGTDLATASASAAGLDGATLVDLAHWVRDTPDLPIFSILISRNDTLVFELYTGGLERPAAHYMMSVTKSVLSSLVGAAIKTGDIKSLEMPLSQFLPRTLFASDADVARFGTLRLENVMGMSALNVSDYPRDTSAAALAHLSAFGGSSNRIAFVLREPLLTQPGRDFLYNDDTPMLAADAVQYGTGRRLFDFRKRVLFDPLGFVNEEWMHEDQAGIDMGGYGFRMRPIDMQKFGLLYLHTGAWKGQQLLPLDWVDKSFTPYMKSAPGLANNNYGWFRWTYSYGAGWRSLVADGWRGQRILINPDHGIVVTMTGYIEVQDEYAVFDKLMTQYVIPAVTRGSRSDIQPALDAALAEVHAGKSRIKPGAESRMIPSTAPKEQPIPFRP